MAAAANDAMMSDRLTAIADKGYEKGEENVAREDAGISIVAPFDKADFGYGSDKDVYVCLAGQNLTYRFTGQQNGKAIRSYRSGACFDCTIKNKCASSKERRVRQWEKQDVLERDQKRLKKDPARLAVRSMTVEHANGTIKS